MFSIPNYTWSLFTEVINKNVKWRDEYNFHIWHDQVRSLGGFKSQTDENYTPRV